MSPQARKGVFKGKLQWLKEDRKTQYRNRDSYNVYLKVIHTELSFRLHPVEFDTLDFNVRRQVNCLIDKKYQNQKLKIINLVSRKNKPLINQEKNFSNHTFFKRFINLSNSKFIKKEYLLAFGAMALIS